MRRIVNGLLLRDETVLMARRSDTRKAFASLWSFPGGHIENGETPEQALIRELREEIGVTPTSFAHHVDLPVSRPDGYHAMFSMFRVTDWTGKPTLCNAEHSALCWYPLGQTEQLHDIALASYQALLRSLLPDPISGAWPE